jgi:hypothetical protein
VHEGSCAWQKINIGMEMTMGNARAMDCCDDTMENELIVLA